MIGIFPDPYPDELLYSVLARYQDLVRYPSRKRAIEEVLGTANAIAVIDLPSHIDHLVHVLPLGHCYSAEYLIERHTLLPIYSPFLEKKQLNAVIADMRGNGGPEIHRRAGIMAGGINPPDWLRYCPTCAAMDRQTYGQTFWHRVHQVPGVEVCPEHLAALKCSRVSRTKRRTRHEFLHAEEVIPAAADADLANATADSRLQRIAEDVAWLVTQQNVAPGLRSLCTRYRSLLQDRGLATSSGRVRVRDLLRGFLAVFPPEFLAHLQCDLDVDSDSNWLVRLVRSPRGAQSPIRHLLLMQFLGLSAKEFFERAGEFDPFGGAPWPCLNPASSHYRQPTITVFRVGWSTDRRSPVGSFLCHLCGFEYARNGPDACADDRFRYAWVRSFGPMWESTLAALWADPSVSLRSIAWQLQVDPLTVKRYAVRLGLDFPRGAIRPTTKRPDARLGAGRPENAADRREQYRTEWLAAIEREPLAGFTDLRRKHLRVFTWLYRNDAEWLATHRPTPRPRRTRQARVDWDRRDSELAAQVPFVAARLRSAAGRPKQVSGAAIARELGRLELIQTHIDKLPLTKAALEAWVEDRVSFAVRRIAWTSEMSTTGPLPHWQLVRKAGLRPELLDVVEVRDALDRATARLERGERLEATG